MKKTKIMIGSCLAVCMLMMLPSISAVEFNTVVEKKFDSELLSSERGLLWSFLEWLWLRLSDGFIAYVLRAVFEAISWIIFGPPPKI